MSSFNRERELPNYFSSSFVNNNSLHPEKNILLNQKLKSRQEIISLSETSKFKTYVDTVFEEEVVNLKKRREEDFSNKRKINRKSEAVDFEDREDGHNLANSKFSEISNFNNLEIKDNHFGPQYADHNCFDPTQECTYEGALEESLFLDNQEMKDDTEKMEKMERKEKNYGAYTLSSNNYKESCSTSSKGNFEKNEIYEKSLKTKKSILNQNYNEAQKARMNNSQFISQRDAGILQQLLQSPITYSDCMKTLNFIYKISQEKKNLELLSKMGFPYLISKLIQSIPDTKNLPLNKTELNKDNNDNKDNKDNKHNMESGSDINYRMLQSALIALGSFLEKKYIEFYMIKSALHKILSVLKSFHVKQYHLEDHFLKFCLWIINFSSTNFTKKTVNLILEHEMEKNLMAYLNYCCESEPLSEQTTLYTLRIIGDICTCSDTKTQKVLDEGLIKFLKRFMTSSNAALRKDSVWIISNISVGTQYQIQGLIEEDVFLILKNILARDISIIKKEAIWAICGLSNNKNPYHAEILIEQGIIEVLYDFLSNSNPRFIILSLEAIVNFLEIDNIFYRHSGEFQDKSVLKTKLIPLGFLETLEGLQYHPNQVVYERVSYVIDNYLSSCEDEDFQII